LFQVFCYLSSSANTTESCRFIVPVFNWHVCVYRV
jgi:hypothetical protein